MPESKGKEPIEEEENIEEEEKNIEKKEEEEIESKIELININEEEFKKDFFPEDGFLKTLYYNGVILKHIAQNHAVAEEEDIKEAIFFDALLVNKYKSSENININFVLKKCPVCKKDIKNNNRTNYFKYVEEYENAN